MTADLPPDTLLTADCGFFGYEFWSELVVSNREFVIRVGGNDRLLMKTEPKPRRRKKEKTAGTQAVKLRMPPFKSKSI